MTSRKVSPWTVLRSIKPLKPLTGPRRKGASRMALIPPAVLSSLNAGRTETATLVEWLAIDMAALIHAACEDAALTDAHGVPSSPALAAKARARRELPFNQRLKAVGADLAAAIAESPRPRESIAALAAHPSDMVRSWLCFALGASPIPALPERISLARFFAADRSMATRESAWDALRPHLLADLAQSIDLLDDWVRDPDPNVRRCAIEATRPRGVWCTHIEVLKADPSAALPLLEPVRSDPARYVQASLANWLNDASKSQPAWVGTLCKRWLKESPMPETAWIVNRALRTIRKKAALPQSSLSPKGRAKARTVLSPRRAR